MWDGLKKDKARLANIRKVQVKDERSLQDILAGLL